MSAGIALLLLVATTGCGRRAARPTEATIGYQHELVTLDPHAHDDETTRAVLQGIFEPLVRLSPDLKIEPCLAERWTTPSPTRWRFRIRAGVFFHDGTPLTTEAVLASLRRAYGGNGSTVATYLSSVASFQRAADEPQSIEILTVRPFPLLLTRLAMIDIVPPGFDAHHPVGTGPYRWVSGTPRGPLVLQRWDRYWGPPPDVETLRIRSVPTEEQLLRLLNMQVLDVMAAVTRHFLNGHPPGPAYTVIRVPTLTTLMLGFNMRDPRYQDARVREAIDLAINRGDLVNEAFPGQCARVADSLLPVEVFGYSPAKVAAAADPGRARRLLRAAGVPEGAEVILEYSGERPMVIAFLSAALSRIGLRLRARRYSYETFYRRFLEGKSGVFFFGWSFRFADASDFLDAAVHSREPERRFGLQNGSGYADPAVDRWIEEASTESNSAKRLDLIHNILERVARDRPYLPLYHLSQTVLVRKPFTIHPRQGSWLVPQDLGLPYED